MRKISTLLVLMTSISLMATDGALSGKFTINANGDQIVFSKGNLQYVGTWQFAEHQWDTIGNAQEDNHRDLFGWGTGDAPNKVSPSNNDYSTFTDWGTNPITNGGNKANLWRTLTKDEWVYLFYGRTNAAKLFGMGSVDGVNGTILLPDNWAGDKFTDTENGLTDQGALYRNLNGTNYNFHTYTTESWAVMESGGAVFLPAAGNHQGAAPYNVGSIGFYWSATLYNTNEGHSHFLNFSSSVLNPQGKHERRFGRSVRLVKAAPTATGTCGTDLEWDLTEGVLTIDGTSNMENYSSTNAPWYDYRASITAVSLPEGLTSIGAYAFSGCTGLTSVTIPSSVTNINNSAFSGCTGLNAVHISNLNAWCAINFDEEYANPLYNAHHLYMNGEEVTELTIPDGITEINYYTFCGCSGLTSVTIPSSVAHIRSYAFGLCTGLTSITIPNGVSSLGTYVFYECTGLSSVTIPSSVTYIGGFSFVRCTALASITNYATTPQSIDSYRFTSVNKSTCVLHVPEGSVAAYQAASGWSDFTNIVAISKTPTGVEPISHEPEATCQKFIKDGQLIINHNGKLYNALGVEIK